MISLFRNFFQSKIGLPIFIGFLIIVALAFAASDISGSSTFGGLTGDDKVVVIGDEPVTANEMRGAVQNGFDRARQSNPTLTIQQFIEQGGLESEVELLIDRYSMGQFARDNGLRAGDNLVNSEILQIPAFRSLTGEFDQQTYQAALRRQGITDAILRKDIGDGLLNQQVLRPAFAAPRLPRAAARQYAALVLERRVGQVALIPSSEYAPSEDPGDEALAAYYAQNNSDFIVPERRTIRFASFGAESITQDLTPSAEAVAARYERDKTDYEAIERRAITSFVVPTQEAANALVERVRGGISLEAAAAEAGFSASPSELQDRETLAGETGEALAEAVFATQNGAIVDPARAQLGWYVARVDDVERTSARSLAEVSDEIAAQLSAEAQAGALIDLSARIEELVDGGTSLSDVANEFGLEINVIPDVTADGRLFGGLGQGISPALRPLLDTAFQMEQSKPQLAELIPGVQFMVFDVGDIVESAAPPIDEVREGVLAAWRRSEGSKLAKEAADRILESVQGGAALRDAMRAENGDLDQIEDINIERRQLLANQQRGIPTALVLMFSMAQGTTKLLEDQNDLGWFVVDLDRIVTDPIEDDNPVLTDTQDQLSTALSSEYNTQLLRAVREEIGVERNEDAIEALRRSLTGES